MRVVINRIHTKMYIRNNMVEATVGNPHAHDREYRSFTVIDVVHELEVGSVGSVQLTIPRT